MKKLVFYFIAAVVIFSTSCGKEDETNVSVTGVVFLNKPQEALYVGEQGKFEALVGPDGASNKEVIWSSSDPAIEINASTGEYTVKPIPGTAAVAVITVTTVDGEKTDNASITQIRLRIV